MKTNVHLEEKKRCEVLSTLGLWVLHYLTLLLYNGKWQVYRHYQLKAKEAEDVTKTDPLAQTINVQKKKEPKELKQQPTTSKDGQDVTFKKPSLHLQLSRRPFLCCNAPFQIISVLARINLWIVKLCPE